MRTSKMWEPKKLPRDEHVYIIKNLKGKYIHKSGNFFIKLLSLILIFGGIYNIIQILYGNIAFGLCEIAMCISSINMGIFVFLISFEFYYFSNDCIYKSDFFNKKNWCISKKRIKKVDLIARTHIQHPFL